MIQDFKLQIDEAEKKIKELKNHFGFEEKNKEFKELTEAVETSDFWQKQRQAVEIQQKFSQLKKELADIKKLEDELTNLKNLGSLAAGNSREEKKLADEIEKLNFQVAKKSQELFFSGKYERGSAILVIEAGAGGRDAEDWAAMLLRMYQRWAERKNFSLKILQQHFGEGGGPDGRIGIKEVLFEIKGKFAYGLLKSEAGTHRLVRLSPFSAKNLRHTSFVRVQVLPKISSETSEIKLNPDDLRIETFRSSGKGGQNVNKRETAVRIIHLPTGLRAECQIERFQPLNRKIAEGILLGKIIDQKEKERQKEITELKGNEKPADFGSQIRSYVFHPYQMVKDLRSGIETSNVEAVLDGGIDGFLKI